MKIQYPRPPHTRRQPFLDSPHMTSRVRCRRRFGGGLLAVPWRGGAIVVRSGTAGGGGEGVVACV